MAGELAEHGHGGLQDAIPRDDEPDDARAVLERVDDARLWALQGEDVLEHRRRVRPLRALPAPSRAGALARLGLCADSAALPPGYTGKKFPPTLGIPPTLGSGRGDSEPIIL